jgi:hypothetical protein
MLSERSFFGIVLRLLILCLLQVLWLLLVRALIKTLAVHFAPVKGLGGLLLAFKTADKQLLAIGAAKTMLADPEFPAWALFAIWADNLAADKMWFFSYPGGWRRRFV